MKIITALQNPKTNEKLKKETEYEIIGNDIQYQEGIIEILEKNKNIDLIIISEILPGELSFKKIIEKIKIIKKEINIIVILKKENEEVKNYLISKGIFNIFYNNKITNDELIKEINKINNIKKENEINEEIKKLKEIILKQEEKNKLKINIINLKKIKSKIINNKYLKTIKNKILNNTNPRRCRGELRSPDKTKKIISIVRNKRCWKKYF